ncbi:replication initiation and membrane attachment family protein [Sediminibacillus albus]|uniref:Replicative DNA helicase loader DnaB n=1 Tax=Sediminibacillus albus TaxID=407036 RepID=A0A1G9BT07_9BACI|nr:DnaD domain protein [Sediminibacillus albus]SDK42513.1 replicative DNA helicase loader DnaB [Sediminibacillus albus]
MNHQHIGKLLPIDGFYIRLPKDITANCFQSLTHLYQPLVGVEAISLYQTLLSECQLRSNQQNPQTHHSLMNYLSLPLDRLYQARLKLEGIGLMNTYKEESGQNNVYIYQLNPPFSPADFFNDGMLSQLLYHHLGDKKFLDLRGLFGIDEENGEGFGEDVTMGFADVFDTYINHFAAQTSPGEEKPAQKDQGLSLPEQNIDFSWLEQMLKQRMIPSRKVLTSSNRKLIVQMAVLYGLTSQDIESAVMWAINEDNQLDGGEFKSACHDLFQANTRKSDVKLVDRSHKNNQIKAEQKPETKEGQFIQMLEEISPKQLLEDLSGGNQASAQDLKVIRDVMTQQGLAPGVMNVLVHYVLLKTDMKLSKAYLEKIASHWARKNVKNVKQAMMLAKSENQKYQQWGNDKQYYKKSGKKEVIPEWFKERKEQKQSSTAKNHTNPAEDNPEELGELLKDYLKNGS